MTMKDICVGIDVGGTTVKMGLFRADGKLLKKWEIVTQKADRGAAIIGDIADSLWHELAKEELSSDRIRGVGMGVPGAVLPDGMVDFCVNIGWKNKNAAKELSERLNDIPVYVANDANVAALGEMWQGGGKGYKDLVMVTLGTGVGGGVIVNEQIISGSHGLGGEIGHIHVREEEQEKCNCGGVGCLEQVASATGIAREARRMMAAGDSPSLLREFGDAVSAKDVLDCAKQGDEMALRVMQTVCHYLGLTLSTITLVADPEIFVLGGGVSKAGTFLIELLEPHYEQYMAISPKKAVLALAKLGNDAGIYGAARMVLGK